MMPIGEGEQGDQVHNSEGEAQEELDADQAHDDGGEQEAQQQRLVRDPGQPSQAEVDEHNVTHIPYRPWCEWCVRGKAKRSPSRRVCGTYSQHAHAKVRVDYA